MIFVQQCSSADVGRGDVLSIYTNFALVQVTRNSLFHYAANVCFTPVPASTAGCTSSLFFLYSSNNFLYSDPG